eukprot:CAMPEP_0177792368 /NCGR_PEP_ID=MMETSP0491_2-20121128/24488_1 /TAXON_ID=63592 /ORGANISM="Tetraselmis chuii, Strain PLY429" /LENGTH=433 /DNA_ID=CAMNT_0019314779 /DNA_START=119 /DNA_END=1420 /DNA_ORIENTATION=+
MEPRYRSCPGDGLPPLLLTAESQQTYYTSSATSALMAAHLASLHMAMPYSSSPLKGAVMSPAVPKRRFVRRCVSAAGALTRHPSPAEVATLRRRYTEPLGRARSGEQARDGSANSRTATARKLRHGSAENIGCRRQMEDRVILCPDLTTSTSCAKAPCGATDGTYAFYGILDGHDGFNAAQFVQERLLGNIIGDECFADDIPAAMVSGFIETDRQYGAAVATGAFQDDGTTALTALVWGRRVYVANLGDCRAVLSHRGKAVQLSRDQNPQDGVEKKRVLRAGGYFCSDGRLCGHLTVTRCIGDWTLDWFDDSGELVTLKSADGHGVLTAEPEVTEHHLHRDDEFLLMGCDGLWGVFGNQRAVEWARLRLQVHNDPQACAEELVAEALKRNSTDNISVVVLCFQEHRPSRRYGGQGVRKCMSSGAVTRLAQFLD